MSASLFKPQDHVVFSDLDGGEGVLVDLNAKRYYTLNETAIFVWRGLEKGLPAAEIARELANDYDVTPERATASVAKLLDELTTRKLVASS